jgi:hypothetical protein
VTGQLLRSLSDRAPSGKSPCGGRPVWRPPMTVDQHTDGAAYLALVRACARDLFDPRSVTLPM